MKTFKKHPFFWIGKDPHAQINFDTFLKSEKVAQLMCVGGTPPKLRNTHLDIRDVHLFFPYPFLQALSHFPLSCMSPLCKIPVPAFSRTCLNCHD